LVAAICEKRPGFSRPLVLFAVIVRESGRSSTPRFLDSVVGASVYWMPAFAGMTIRYSAASASLSAG
jgi:hypothetical protein